MRTFLTRTTFGAAGVVLAGFGMATAAYAADDDLIMDGSAIYVGETPWLPPADDCEVRFTIEDCDLSVDVDDRLQAQLPTGVEMIDPDSLDVGLGSGDGTDGGTEESEGTVADESADSEAAGPEESTSGAGEEPSGEEDSAEPDATASNAGEPSTAEDEGETGDGGRSTHTDTSGDADNDTQPDVSDGEASENAADEPTPEPDESTITPVTRSVSGDGGGTSDLLFVVLIGALATFGIGMVGIGLIRRTQPVRNRRW